VFVVFETEAENERLSPSNTDPELGVMLTVMEGGGGDEGATEPAPPPPQPRVHALIARRIAGITFSRCADESVCHKVFSLRVCGRGRMSHALHFRVHVFSRLSSRYDRLATMPQIPLNVRRSNWLRSRSIFCNCASRFFPLSKIESSIPKRNFTPS
jgi:hypothetical protein